MENFILQVKRNETWVQYPEQGGDISLALMEFMLQRGIESRAIAKVNGHVDMFNINEMREVLEAWAEVVRLH
jgi:hypothetical protein